uniref:ATP-dependent DNA helicase n=1 Tax=Tanacetum cinerariifolium TaxID=118510 RepID=A0A699H6V8_TANCI|nr:DNA helicase [Tanacetum cinerariifolium]
MLKLDVLDIVLIGYGPGCDVPSIGTPLASCSGWISGLYLDVFLKCSEFCGVKLQRECSTTFRVIFGRVSKVFSGFWKVPCVQQDMGLRGDGLDKRKLQPSGHSDIFEAYLALCSTDAGSRCSISLSQITANFNSNLVHTSFSSLCGPSVSVLDRSFHANLNAVTIIAGSQNSYPISRDGGNTRVNCQLGSTIGVSNNGSSASHHARNVQVRPRLISAASVPSTSRRTGRRVLTSASTVDTTSVARAGTSYTYSDFEDCDRRCRYCGASFWCARIQMQPPHEPPECIKSLFGNKHFMENIRTYSQMFAITSFGANIDESINARKGLMHHFRGIDNSQLEPGIVKGLIHFLDAHNELVQLFRTVRDKCRELDIPEFKIRLYKTKGARGYELPTLNTLGEMVFESGITDNANFDVIIQHRDGSTQKVNKLYPSYMSLQFPLLFIYGQPWRDTIPTVFEQKIQALIAFLKEQRIFGNVDSASRIRIDEDVDRFISAELPDPIIDPEGYNVVLELMMHGPCGAVNLKAACMKGDKCSMKFPKKFNQKTFFDEHGHVHYRRRDTTYWRILKFDIHRREIAVQILVVYLEDMQRITFRDKDRLKSVIDLPGKKSTTLTKWFAFNEANEVGRHLSYLEFPSNLRGELLFSRMLLCHQKGYRDFWEVQTVKGVFYLTYRAACQALGLLGDDKEWEISFEEACGPATPEELRFLFSHILFYCDVLIFVYGHGGTGKTFLWKTIISSPRCEGNIVLAVASSGIASLLLPSDHTAHSIFKLPFELTDESLCKITKNTQLGKLLADTDHIIWDEAPMNDRCCFEALDKNLRDIVDKPSSLSGRKSVLLGGDFRQTLLVKKGTSKMEVIASCLSESALWPSFKVFTLKYNMSLARPDISLEERSLVNSFASWSLDIGDGKISEPVEEDPENTSWVHILPAYYLPPDEQDIINSKVLAMVPGESTIYMSEDKATPTENDGAETEMLYPIEHLNTLKLPGFPPHQLELKVGAPVMLLRNVNIAGRLCNGMRMIVRQLITKLIEVKIIIGTRGNAIQANMALKETDYFDAKLEMRLAYRISNFSCEATSRFQQTLENEASLRFETKIVEFEFQVVNYEREISHFKNLFDSITSNRAHAKLHSLIYENAKLRAWLFENTSESMNNTSRTSVTPHVDKPKLLAVTHYSKKLHASIPSHSVPQPREFNVVKHRNHHVTFKENVSSDTVNASYTGLVHTARTRRPQPKGISRNDRVLSASKSSEVKKNVTVEDHHRILLLSKNQKTMSSECNNIKLAIQNDKSEIVCEVAFMRNTCFIRDLDGVDLLKGNRSTNLYTINLYDMASASPIGKKQKSLLPTQTSLFLLRFLQPDGIKSTKA